MMVPHKETDGTEWRGISQDVVDQVNTDVIAATGDSILQKPTADAVALETDLVWICRGLYCKM